ncbi:hypothetical protein Cgig2_011634 [Carnegiea gigantea]|uniref:Uncharacterized protein n=1 Tax=Carnegiea gigantea TaxID=171969 RepID=A0A9Q1GTB6_9CARY|nr:hypothetical protein Cgig2_011634 [Carnegiea gigantea]
MFPVEGRIPSFGKDLFDSRSRLVDSRRVCSLDDDVVESICRVNAPALVPRPQCPLRAPQGGISVFNTNAVIKEVDKNDARVFSKAILDKVSRTPFDGLPSLKGVDIIPLKSKSYFGQTSAEKHDSSRVEVQGKLDETSHQLNTEGAHYQAKMVELKRAWELLKELQFLEDQKKDLSSQVVGGEHLLQEAERKIGMLNATKVMDAAPKASLEMAEAYIKEPFEDLTNFQ